ncbi:MAG: TetR/AcrR family transcriptional regulator [Leptospiraceae bacterium]|nr:TetR/AcrR family transcriptional regulator [Leptospiraceae bacterium]MCP5499886.1 TetR/AcrR family transcriptional regulator [Leptospiraceae bacterium]
MPKIVNHDEYREELLRNSFELFARKGYDSVSMREIARELNISTGTLYHYFPNKSSIFRQMIELHSRNRILKIISELNSELPLKEKFVVMSKNILEVEKFFQDMLFLLFDYYRKNDSKDPENFIQPIFNYYKFTIVKTLEIQDSELADLVLSFLIGIIVQRMINPEVDAASQLLSFVSLMEAGKDLQEIKSKHQVFNLRSILDRIS